MTRINGLTADDVTGSHQDGSILAQEIIEQPPSVNDLAKLLANSMKSPHCRPKTIYLRDNSEWQELFLHLKQLKIEVVVTESFTKPTGP